MSSAFRKLIVRQSTNARSMSAAQAGTHGEAAEKLWRNLTLYLGLPVVAMVSFLVLKKELTEPHGRPEFRPYEHLRIRRKNFPWGDGKKSFFHNPHTNALPDGYEEEHH